MATHLTQILPDAEALAHRAAELFVMASSSTISARGTFSVAISGGSTPLHLYKLLAEPPYKDGIDWDKVHVFFADERCVAPTDELSNFRAANEALLMKVNPHIHRIEGELGAQEAARRYTHVIGGVLESKLDMVLLGMGADGHTASLFPGSPALDETGLPAVAVEDKTPQRVSLTLPVINAARTVIFHVAGEDKAQTVSAVLSGQMPEAPAAQVTDRALWLLDQAAASKL